MCASAHLPPNWQLLQDVRAGGAGKERLLGAARHRALRGPAALHSHSCPWPEAPGEPGAACSPAGSDSLSMLCSFQLLAHPDVGEDDSEALRHLQRLLKHPNRVTYSVVLSALLPASETPVTVSRAHYCEGRWAFVLKVSWPAPGQLGGLCSARSSVAQKKWPRNELAMEGPSGSLGSFPCMPCTFWSGSEKGAQSLCSAALLFLPLLPSHTQGLPMAIACLVAAARCDSRAASARARWQPGALAPQASGQGGLSSFHQMETLSFLQARKLPVLLPGIIQGLHVARADTKMKALLLIGNVMDHVKRKQASSIALQVAGDILPLFNDVRLLQDLSPQMGTLMTAAPREGGLLRSL